MKKILLAACVAVLLLISTGVSSDFAYAKTMKGYTRIEHLDNVAKNSKTNIVNITKTGAVIREENVLNIAFSENFNSKYYRNGDMVQFTFVDDVKTEEGTIVIPKNSNLIGAIRNIQKPKWGSRNARVTMDFMFILFPNGTRLSVSMALANGKGYLSAGVKETAGKIAGYTVGTGAAGAGLGAAIGTISSNTIPGLIIGSSIGGGVGLISGIASPGLHYRAKKGYFIPVRFEDNLRVPNL